MCEQRFVAAPFFSALEAAQNAVTARRMDSPLSGSLVILGYWRSGTTLLHEYLGLDGRLTYPSTYACMNPHHFVLTQARALATAGPSVTRPMDSMVVRADTPQEDEFALLSLGARSPYEALLFPSRLQQALATADPKDLSPVDEEQWRRVFLKFLRRVSLIGNGRPLVLKSPTHGYRIQTLRELLPNARFVLVVRQPGVVFESAIRMWQKLFSLYAFEPVPSEDRIREIVLADRVRFEEKLVCGLATIPDRCQTSIRYESLVADPVETLRGIYERLDVGEFETVRPAIEQKVRQNADYKPAATAPEGIWKERVDVAWRDIIARYGYA